MAPPVTSSSTLLVARARLHILALLARTMFHNALHSRARMEARAQKSLEDIIVLAQLDTAVQTVPAFVLQIAQHARTPLFVLSAQILPFFKTACALMHAVLVRSQILTR